MKILLVTPPFTQLNTPYPATAYLTGFLQAQGYDVEQRDASLDVALKVFSKKGLQEVHKILNEKLKNKKPKNLPDSLQFFQYAAKDYIECIDPVVQFLQGQRPELESVIAAREFLPEGPLFTAAMENIAAAHSMGIEPDLSAPAKYFASLFMDDLVKAIQEGIDPQFGLSRYAEKLAASAPSFDPLEKALHKKQSTFFDEKIDQVTAEYFKAMQPDVVLLTVPFPGNVYAAFRMAQRFKKLAAKSKQKITVLLGGGYANTELRELKEPRVFDYFDAITLDDGEAPLLAYLKSLKNPDQPLLRTFVREKGKVVFKTTATLHDFPQKDLPTPTYRGLDLDRYLSLVEMLNPMHRIWSEGHWNKLTVAHGCYWKKCSFCDVNLDYIGRYEQSPAVKTVDRMEALCKETGRNGFHFVDEAAPPAALKAIAQEIINRKLIVRWWGNVRFDKSFTPELCQLLAKSGCIAFTGGLEVANERLLKLINKGVTLPQVTAVTKAMRDAGIMVHAYLMYGFPTQTEEETLESLENVRKLFKQGCLDSAYWHRFSATVHSPIGKDPKSFGIKLHPAKSTFAVNDLDFTDPTGTDHDWLGRGLKKALYNYMHGMGLDEDVRVWFE